MCKDKRQPGEAIVKSVLAEDNELNESELYKELGTLTKDAYVANPLNQFIFTVNGYYNMFRGMRDSQRKVNLDKIPKDLPILVVSGQNDPVGEFGKGPEIVAETYRKTGIQDVTLKLFPDDRHEILNELDKEVVDQYLLNWIETRM